MDQKKSASGLSLAIRKTLFSFKNNSSLVEKSNAGEFTIKVANTLEEREAVFNLAYQVYLKKGYIKENENEWLIQSYDTNSETIILIVQDRQKNIAGTITLVFDGDSKLPAEKIYNNELKLLRSSGKKMVEISRLVISHEHRNSKEILVLLFNYLAIITHHVKNYHGIITQVNPRHKTYYKSLLRFDEIGGEKPCPIVQNAPAVLLYLATSTYLSEITRKCAELKVENKNRSLYPYFIRAEQESLVAHYLAKQIRPMSMEEKIYFGLSESGIGKSVCV